MSSALKLYSFSGACTLSVDIVFDWYGIDYQNIILEKDELKEDWFLNINPYGTVPVVIKGEETLTELLAILLDIYEEVGSDDDTNKTELYYWLSFLSGTLHAHFRIYFEPERYTEGNQTDSIKNKVERLIRVDLNSINHSLSQKEYLVSSKPSIADAMFFPMLLWSYRFIRGIHDLKNLRSYAERMLKDDSVKNAMNIYKLDRDILQHSLGQ